MENLIHCLPHPVLLVLVTVLTLVYALNVWWKRKWEVHECLPPGSMGYLFFGETLRLLIQGPIGFSKKAGKITKTHLFGRPTIMVAGANNVRQLYNGEEDIVASAWPESTRKLLGSNYIAMQRGPTHRRLRKAVLSSLKTNWLDEYIPRMEQLLKDHMEKWCTESTFLALHKIEQMAFAVAWEIIVGMDLSEDHETELYLKFREYMKGIFTIPLNLPGLPYRKALQAKAFIHNYIERRIGLGTDMSKPSILKCVLEDRLSTSEEGLSNDEIKDLATGLLFTGHDTVSSATTSLLLCLSKHTQVTHKIVDELKGKDLFEIKTGEIKHNALNGLEYLNGVIREVLRLYPPVSGSSRVALKSFYIGGYHVPNGWTVLPVIRATMEKTTVYTNKEEFAPERWLEKDMKGNVNYNYIPFGAGIRNCVGKEYAKLFLHLFTIVYVKDYTCEMKSSPEFVAIPALKPKDGLPVKFMHL